MGALTVKRFSAENFLSPAKSGPKIVVFRYLPGFNVIFFVFLPRKDTSFSIFHSGSRACFIPGVRSPLIGPFSPYPSKARHYARTLKNGVDEC